ncbi:hypothetical protein, partial [Ruminococcus sp.]|uniref:hypothetical protein n=1 Tax=Ruminococcus sp. TaxID=41978 RepID=UPI003F7DC970
AKRLAVWQPERRKPNATSTKESHATKTTNLPLFKGKSATHKNFCVLQNIFSLRITQVQLSRFLPHIGLNFCFLLKS